MALARVRAELRTNIVQRDEIARNQKRMLEEAAGATQQEFDASSIHRYYQYERHLARLAVEKDAAIAELRETEEERRADLEEAMKKKRIVERLKERHRDALFADLNKEEQAVLDETAINQAAVDGGRTRQS